MRTSVVAVMVATLMSSAAEARSEVYAPSYERIRAGLERGAVVSPRVARAVTWSNASADSPELTRGASSGARAHASRPQTNGRDSVWNGLLIGAGIGGGAGYLWARDICGSNDSECFAIAAPVGVLAGAGIGAAVGALLDAFQK